MEENRSPGELIDGLDDLLVHVALRRAMRKRTEQLAALVKEAPGSHGFSNGMTAAGRRQVKACVLFFCAVMLGLFFGFCRVPWGVAVAGVLLAVAVLLFVSVGYLRKKACFVLYNSQVVRILSPRGEEELPYARIAEAHVHEDQLALCMQEKNVVLTAGAAENLQEMQAFADHLTGVMPGRVHYHGPVDDSEDE